MIATASRLPDAAIRGVRLLGSAVAAWWQDDLLRVGASLAYYTLFAIAPILLIAVAVAGSVFGDEAVRGEVAAQLDGLIGTTGASAVQGLIQGARWPTGNLIAVIVGLVTTVLAATGVFLELQTALNVVWRVKSTDNSWSRFLWNRAQSFGVVVAIGFLLLVSLVFSAALAALAAWVEGRLPAAPLLIAILNFLTSTIATALLFGLLFRTLPDVPLRYRDVAVGGLVTAFLFAVGKYLIGLYIGQSSAATSYGAAGSVVALMIWVYYSSQILLIGAEFTRLYGESIAGSTLRAAGPSPG